MSQQEKRIHQVFGKSCCSAGKSEQSAYRRAKVAERVLPSTMNKFGFVAKDKAESVLTHKKLNCYNFKISFNVVLTCLLHPPSTITFRKGYI